MAWFNKPAAAEEQPQKVTLERMNQALTQGLGLNGTLDDDGAPVFYCIINDVPFAFNCSNELAMLVTSDIFQHHLPAERYNEVLAWATNHNAATHYITAVVHNEERGTRISFDAPIHCSPGMTDDQIEKNLEHRIRGCLYAIDQYAEAFGITYEESDDE